MDTLEAIHTRRSIREYTDQPVSEELVQEIIGAAMMAPSAGNVRPWQFIVLDDPEVVSQIPRIHPHGAMAVNAPVSIMVCGDLSLEKSPGNWLADCSAATQNLLLAAHAKGLGGVWTGLYPEQERIEGFRELLGLPENVIPLVLVPIGYPAYEGGRQDRFEPNKIHRNHW
ncbi:MAG: nitroreductase family protein [Gemmatimonadetes bacterium]|nr:nitroreductase family protein [Gemmatimonadota bacterium]